MGISLECDICLAARDTSDMQTRHTELMRHNLAAGPSFCPDSSERENIHFTSERLRQMTRVYFNDGLANMFSFEEIIWCECQYFKRFISLINEDKS